MANVNYYIGPWVLERPNLWGPPAGIVGSIDFGSLPDCEQIDGTQRKVGLFCTPADTTLSSEYDLIDTGDGREIVLVQRHIDLIYSVLGITVAGATLSDAIAAALLDGDPTGQDRWKPLQPTVENYLDVHLGGHSRIFHERFRWGQHKHTNRLRDLLRADCKQLSQEYRDDEKRLRQLAKQLRNANGGKDADKCDFVADRLKNDQQAGRWLDSVCSQYGCDASEITSEFQRQPHETSISENFTRADGTTIGNLLSWTEVARPWSTYSNQVYIDTASTTTYGAARAESDLSSSNNYAQCKAVTINQGNPGSAANELGVASRFASSATTYYGATWYDGDDDLYNRKSVAGTNTNIGTKASGIISDNDTLKSTSDGSVITADAIIASLNTSTTDTAISTGTRCGLHGMYYNGSAPIWDDFVAADLAAASNPKNVMGGIILDGPFRRVVL